METPNFTSCPLCAGPMQRIAIGKYFSSEPVKASSIPEKKQAEGYKCLRCGKVWRDSELGFKK